MENNSNCRESETLPCNFRKLPLAERRRVLEQCFSLLPDEMETIRGNTLQSDLSDLMVESSVGIVPVPLGIVRGLIIDGTERVVPLATEEPSVVAAANFAARILQDAVEPGVHTWTTEPVMRSQIALTGVTSEGEQRLRAAEPDIIRELKTIHSRLISRGGGYRGMEVKRLPESRIVVLELLIDVRDAMGANLLNTAAEKVKPLAVRISGGEPLMAILTNASEERRAGAAFSLPVENLTRPVPPGMTPDQVARKVELASRFAAEDPRRAVTHNKGIMNAVTALTLATGNDTRAVEAAAHAWAARSGQVRGLSTFTVSDGTLKGELELPLALGTVGGAVTVHPGARLVLKVLGNPDSAGLARIAAGVGLVQNLAALLALVTEGIQKGHMKLHARRLAWLAGARGRNVDLVAHRLGDTGDYTVQRAETLFAELQRGCDG